jgi:hypothetical protein
MPADPATPFRDVDQSDWPFLPRLALVTLRIRIGEVSMSGTATPGTTGASVGIGAGIGAGLGLLAALLIGAQVPLGLAVGAAVGLLVGLLVDAAVAARGGRNRP